MKNGKRILVLLFALPMAFALSACEVQDKSGGYENSGATNEAKNGKLRELSLDDVALCVSIPEELVSNDNVSGNCWEITDAEQTFRFSAFISDYTGMSNAADFAEMKEQAQKGKDKGNYTELAYSGFQAYYYTDTYYAGGYLANCKLDLGNGNNVLSCDFRFLGADGKIDKDKTPEEVLDGFLTEPVQAVLKGITKR